MKLALGTVQFGLPYGATNKQGQVGAGEIERILARARAAGIDLLDTAAAYGTSEDVLGASDEARAGFSIVTKTQPLRLESIDAEAVERVVDGVRRSVRRLHVAALDGLLVHHAPDLLAPGGDRLYDALQSLRAEGLVRRLGASVYTVDQLLTLLERYPLEIVQLPMNVLDQAFLQTGTLDRLARGGSRYMCARFSCRAFCLRSVYPGRCKRWNLAGCGSKNVVRKPACPRCKGAWPT